MNIEKNNVENDVYWKRGSQISSNIIAISEGNLTFQKELSILLKEFACLQKVSYHSITL